MAATKIRSFAASVFETPLKRPFVTAAGRKTVSVNVGVTLTLGSGARGYGEASTSLANPHHRPDAILAAVKKLASAARGRDAAESLPLAEEAARAFPDCFPAVAAFEAAVLEAHCADRGMSLAERFGGASAEGETDLTISAVGPEESAEAARAAGSEGFKTLKVKVGKEPAEDLARVKAVRAAAPRVRMILDGNQGMTVDSALKLVDATLKLGVTVEMLEQPLPLDHLAGLSRLVKRCPVPVILDESVKTPEQALRALDAGAAGGFNIKTAKSGYHRSLQIAAIARAAKLPLMIGCMTETAKGLAGSVHLALGTGWFRWLDLDSDHLLAKNEPASWRRAGPRISLKEAR